MDRKLFTASDEKVFKQIFALQFMAASTANRYAVCCDAGRHNILRNPPVEDAIHLAECAWAKWVEIIGVDQDTSVSEVPLEALWGCYRCTYGQIE